MKKHCIFYIVLMIFITIFTASAFAESEIIYCGEDYAIIRVPTLMNPKEFSEGLAVVSDFKIKKYGFIDKTGEIVIPLIFDYAHNFSEGLAPAELDGKWGFIDKNGEFLIPPQYDFVQAFNEGVAIVRLDDKHGCIDKKGNLVLPIEYSGLRNTGAGVIYVYNNGKCGYFNKETGNVVIPVEYDYLEYIEDEYRQVYRDGLARAKKDKKWGYFNRNGDLVIPFEYDYANDFYEGLAHVIKDGKHYYIDKAGAIVLSLEDYDGGGDFHEGLAYVYKIVEHATSPYHSAKFLYGYIDVTGKLVLPLTYSAAGDFHEGIAYTQKEDSLICNYINKDGEIIAEVSYVSPPFNFQNNLLRIRKNGKEGVINAKGEVVIPVEYNIVTQFSEGLMAVQKDGGGYIDMQGNIIVPFEYGEINPFKNNLACVSRSDASVQGGSKYYILEKINAVNPTDSKILVDNIEFSFNAYNIYDNNYFKLRDLAYILNGSDKQFSVDWDDKTGIVSIVTGAPYDAIGGEMDNGEKAQKVPIPTQQEIIFDGQKITLTTYNIDDYNYIKLRDIGKLIDFSVEWSEAGNTISINTSRKYNIN